MERIVPWWQEDLSHRRESPTRKSSCSLEDLSSFYAPDIEKLRHDRVINVVGTNGKGTMVSCLAHLLSQEETVVVTTSPHFYTPRERVQYFSPKEKETIISEKDFSFAYDTLLKREKEHQIHLSYFEILLGISLVFSSLKRPEWLILEAGLGGRLDATAVIPSQWCFLTSIGWDHTEVLGNTLPLITTEKISIMHRHGTCWSAVTQKDLQLIQKSICVRLEASLYLLDSHFGLSDETVTQDGFHCTLWSSQHGSHSFSVQSWARHNLSYIAMSLTFMQCLYPKKILPTTVKVSLPGRMQIIRHDPLILYDVAHNKEGVIALIETLKERLSPEQKKSMVIVFGTIQSKPTKPMQEILHSFCETLWHPPSFHDRACSPEDYQQGTLCSDIFFKTIKDLQEKIIQAQHTVILCGSFYYIDKLFPTDTESFPVISLK